MMSYNEERLCKYSKCEQWRTKTGYKSCKEEVLESIKNILKKKEVSEIDKKYEDDTSNLHP